jgi:hypothetical protein
MTVIALSKYFDNTILKIAQYNYINYNQLSCGNNYNDIIKNILLFFEEKDNTSSSCKKYKTIIYINLIHIPKVDFLFFIKDEKYILNTREKNWLNTENIYMFENNIENILFLKKILHNTL